MRLRAILRGSYGLILALVFTGCRAPHPSTETLPTASPQSVALPGAVNSADAPSAPSVAESHSADLVLYRDAVHGVSFEYPSVWRPLPPGTTGGYLQQPQFASVAPQPLITQMFSPAGTVYANTVLSSLSFSYTVQPHSDARRCAQLPATAAQANDGSHTAIYNGVGFSEASGGDAGMCHHLNSTVDTTLRGSTCVVFERDTSTICPFVKNDKEPRPLTTQEQRALQRHLDEVMESVRVERPCPANASAAKPAMPC